MSEKFYPEIGTHLFMSQRTGNEWVDEVKRPYTVIGVTKSHITVQEAQCIFPQPRYYDMLPIAIEEDPQGKILQLNWAPKKKRWQIDKYKTGYPDIAFFGSGWQFAPYLN